MRLWLLWTVAVPTVLQQESAANAGFLDDTIARHADVAGSAVQASTPLSWLENRFASSVALPL